MRSAACITAFSIIIFAATGSIPAYAQDGPPPNPHVVIETTMGDITIELFRPRALASVVNFLTYVQAGYYDGTIFHRVMRNLIIQGGGVTPDHEPKTEGLRAPILNEATNNLQNRRGSVAMARLGTPNSARAQFFINVGQNMQFNHRNTTPAGFGYAVFGEVVDGMDVVDDISRVSTTRVGRMDDVPRETVLINTIRRIDPPTN